VARSRIRNDDRSPTIGSGRPLRTHDLDSAFRRFFPVILQRQAWPQPVCFCKPARRGVNVLLQAIFAAIQRDRSTPHELRPR